MPSVTWRHSANHLIFAECRLSWHSANTPSQLPCRHPVFFFLRVVSALGKGLPSIRDKAQHSAKVCRVPEIKHLAKICLPSDSLSSVLCRERLMAKFLPSVYEALPSKAAESRCAYTCLMNDTLLVSPHFKWMGKSKIQNKHNFFCCLLPRDRLNTRNLVQRKHMFLESFDCDHCITLRRHGIISFLSAYSAKHVAYPWATTGTYFCCY